MNLIEINEKILHLLRKSLSDFNQFHQKVDLFELPKNWINKVKKQTNLDLNGFVLSIDNYGIIHSFKNHGNPISEARRGQVAITEEDFMNLISIVMDFDEVKLVGLTKRTKNAILQFKKEINGQVYILQEVRNTTKKSKTSRLIFHTMYKKIRQI